MNSETVEDYLKAIYVLEEKEGRAKTSALAAQLGVTAGSVTDTAMSVPRPVNCAVAIMAGSCVLVVVTPTVLAEPGHRL